VIRKRVRPGGGSRDRLEWEDRKEEKGMKKGGMGRRRKGRRG